MVVTMKHKCPYLLFIAVTVHMQLALAQGPSGPRPKKPRTPEDYKPRTLKTLSIKNADEDARTNKEQTLRVYSDILPSKTRVTYVGTTRQTPEVKKDVVSQWAKLYAGVPQSYTEPYGTEVLFKEEADEHWLAVRKDLLPRLRQQIAEGEEVDLYVIRLGAVLFSTRWESVILVENFNKPK